MGEFGNKYSEEEVLKRIAESSKDQILKQNTEYEKRLDMIDEVFHIEPDPAFLEFAQKYDRQRAKTINKRKYSKPLQVVAAVLVCGVAASALAVETSEAFRVKLYNLLFDDESGGVSMLTEDESDLIGDWEDFWYPAYKPEGMKMISAQNDGEMKIQLLSSDNGDREIRLMEFPLENVWEIDTDTNDMEPVTVGNFSGYLFEDKDNARIKIIWMLDDRQISLIGTGKITTKELTKMAENLKYRE